MDTFSSSARGVVFVVDSGTVTKQVRDQSDGGSWSRDHVLTSDWQVRDVAEYLHFLLTNRNILGNAPPVLIVCNKQDSGMAKGKGAVQTLLEKEIEKVSSEKVPVTDDDDVAAPGPHDAQQPAGGHPDRGRHGVPG